MLPDPALAALRLMFRPRLSDVSAILAEHAASESLVTAGLPDAEVFPTATDAVAALAAWSTRHLVPLIGWGAGTSLEGHALALTGGGLRSVFATWRRCLKCRPKTALCAYNPASRVRR